MIQHAQTTDDQIDADLVDYDPDLVELEEIADGAYGDGPWARGRARDLLAELRVPARRAGAAR